MLKYTIATTIFLLALLPYAGLPARHDSVLISILSLTLVGSVIVFLYKNQELFSLEEEKYSSANTESSTKGLEDSIESTQETKSTNQGVNHE